MSYSCYKCGEIDVKEEFQRCLSCQTSHKELCAKLDSKPKVREKKVKEKLFPIKEMKGGIEITTFIDFNDAAIMGIKLE